MGDWMSRVAAGSLFFCGSPLQDEEPQNDRHSNMTTEMPTEEPHLKCAATDELRVDPRETRCRSP